MEISTALVERARRAGAMEHIEDALCDLVRWPQFRAMIMGDLGRAIEAHEATCVQACPVDCSFPQWIQVEDGAGKTERVLTCTAEAEQCPLKRVDD